MQVKLPNLEFFVNLGDWPLEKRRSGALPIFSWCGSDDSEDIVMPTYDVTQSISEILGRCVHFCVYFSKGSIFHFDERRKSPVYIWLNKL